MGKDRLGQGGHVIPVVGRDDPLEGRDRSGNLGLAQESEDSELSQTSVVELPKEASRLLLLSHALVAAKGIVQVERAAGDEFGVKGREVSGLSSLHVVRLGGDLAPEFEETDEQENLELPGVGDGIPSLGGGQTGGELLSAHGHGPRKRDTVRVRQITDEREHGDAAVLDLGLPDETDRFLLGLAPKVLGGQVEGIVESDDRVELPGEGFEIGDALLHGGRRLGGGAGGGEGGSRAGEEGGEEELHR
mmetsp:Transcript_12929/g.37909  ORF Transcript_12929/g.37909 Transcript_12929/m.37909 type:complete len:247 (+) Transcript_12929:304-1044(+)